MKYVLEDQICLKKWKANRQCFTVSGKYKGFPLSDEEYSLLKSCDGSSELVPNDSLRAFEAMHVIRSCGTKKEKLKPGQIREYQNFFFRNIDWTITEPATITAFIAFTQRTMNGTGRSSPKRKPFGCLRKQRDVGSRGYV